MFHSLNYGYKNMKYISEQFEFDLKRYKGIMAMAKNRCIGKDNKMPWRYKEDFNWFREFTMRKNHRNRVLLMGRTTYESMPILMDRKIYALSKTKDEGAGAYMGDSEGIHEIHFIRNVKRIPELEVVVAGGKSIYQQFMPYITEFYVTHIDKEYVGDTFMEPFEHLFSKQEVVREFDFGRVIKYTK